MYRNSVFFATRTGNQFLFGAIRGHTGPGFGQGNVGPKEWFAGMVFGGDVSGVFTPQFLNISAGTFIDRCIKRNFRIPRQMMKVSSNANSGGNYKIFFRIF